MHIQHNNGSKWFIKPPNNEWPRFVTNGNPSTSLYLAFKSIKAADQEQ